MPNRYHPRPLDPSTDFDAFARLVAAVEAEEASEARSDEARLRALLADPNRLWLIVPDPVEPANLLAFASLRYQTPQRGFVSGAAHPHYRRQGLGGALLQAAQAQARQAGAQQLVSWVQASNAGAQACLQKYGFSLAGHDRVFIAPADVPLPEPVWPQGFRVRSLAELGGDLQLLSQVCNLCYHDLFGHSENTITVTPAFFEDLIQRSPDFIQPQGSQIVFAPDGSPIGYCPALLGPATEAAPRARSKTLDAPGIAPQYRHLDLYRPLVLTAMHYLNTHADGPISIETWGDTEAAVATYLALGFESDESQHGLEYMLAL